MLRRVDWAASATSVNDSWILFVLPSSAKLVEVGVVVIGVLAATGQGVVAEGEGVEPAPEPNKEATLRDAGSGVEAASRWAIFWTLAGGAEAGLPAG